MNYARAAWRIFLAWAARKCRLPQQLVWDLEDEASMRMFACSLDFEPVQVTARPPKPTGWRCQHLFVTGLTNVSAGCGCVMEPVYASQTTTSG